MKVGLLTTSFPRFDGDSSGAFVLGFARALAAQGHEVRVLAPEPRRHRPTPQWPGIEVCWVPYVRPRRWQTTFYESGAPDNLRMRPTQWLGAASFTAAMYRASKRKLADCDALVSQWCIPNGLIASMIAEGRPHLSICHATDVRWLSQIPGARMVAQRIARGATSMWFLSAALREQFLATTALERIEASIHVGPMGVDEPPPLRASSAIYRKQLGLDRFTLLVLGRLVPIKGVDQLLYAVASMAEPIGIRIAGDGPERGKLETLALRLGVDAHFEGWVSGDRKEMLFQACDALVVPSRPGDGVPTVIFEAMARKLPVIATDAGGIPEHLRDHKTALLVPTSDAAALTSAIRTLYNDDHLRTSLAANALPQAQRLHWQEKGTVPFFG